MWELVIYLVEVENFDDRFDKEDSRFLLILVCRQLD